MTEKPYTIGKTSYPNKVEGRQQSISESLNNETKPDNTTGSARIEFNTDNLRQLVQDRGIDIIWQRGYLCPCASKMTGAPKPTCPYCHGIGIAYREAHNSRAIIQSQEKGLNNIDIGLLDSGTAILTTYFEIRMGYRDRITVPEVQIPQSMIFYVDEKRIEQGIELRYDVKEVEYITTFEKVLTEDDYTIKQNKLFLNKEFVNSTVSLSVYCTLRYIVADLLKESRYQYTEFLQPQTKFENLPQKVLLKREDVVVSPEPLRLDSDVNGDVKEEVEARVNENKIVNSTTTNSNNNLSSGFFGGGI